jgi:phosphatidylethanolamine-binding protein (PEBP) family uncharacterized protein
MTFHVTTTAFENGAMIPKKFTCDGQDIAPPLTWTEPPKGASICCAIQAFA